MNENLLLEYQFVPNITPPDVPRICRVSPRYGFAYASSKQLASGNIYHNKDKHKVLVLDA